MPLENIAELDQSSKSDAYLNFLQMVTGAALILFMWGHMVLVASVNFGAGVMNAIAGFLEHTYLAQTGGPIIALLFLTHFLLAVRNLPSRSREQISIWRHANRMAHLDTWLWMIQVGTAMTILIMGCIHMWTVLTSLPITAAKSAARIQGGWWLAFYLILLPMVELHVGIGFYRIGVKWGWITRSNRGKLKGFETKLTVGFIVIGLISLITFYFFINALPPGKL